MSVPLLVTVVETPEFIAQTDKLMADENRQELIGYLARNPTAGDLIPGTGGVRKLRAEIPLFALTAFAKNERADLSQDDRHAFRRLTKLLVETYRRGRR